MDLGRRQCVSINPLLVVEYVGDRVRSCSCGYETCTQCLPMQQKGLKLGVQLLSNVVSVLAMTITTLL